MRVRRLQHVSSPFADGDQHALRSFYGELLGLRELPTPAALGHLELVWFSAGDGVELHFFRGVVDGAAERHFCLDIADLEETRRRLQNAGHEPYDDTSIPNRPRFFCRDPAGNLVEFTRIEGPYPTNSSSS
jgi:catechol 2,3-dioxygenase-like lactoylglutathione lyase family enzyme